MYLSSLDTASRMTDQREIDNDQLDTLYSCFVPPLPGILQGGKERTSVHLHTEKSQEDTDGRRTGL